MLSVTRVGGDPGAPAESCAGLKTQFVVASSPEQANVTIDPKAVPGASGTTVKE
jgi:hypothetical protein